MGWDIIDVGKRIKFLFPENYATSLLFSNLPALFYDNRKDNDDEDIPVIGLTNYSFNFCFQ